MGRGNRLLIKQLLKYAFIVIFFLFGFFIWSILWDLPFEYRLGGLILTSGVIIIAMLFDALSIKDVIPLFQR